LFGRSCACLRECQRGDQRTSGCDNAFVHIPFLFFGFCLDFIAKTSAGLAEIGLLLLDQAGHASIRSKLDLFGRLCGGEPISRPIRDKRALYLVEEGAEMVSLWDWVTWGVAHTVTAAAASDRGYKC
jgi:hypothetical protein